MTKVYSTLAVALVTSAVGVYVDMACHISGLLVILGTFLGVVMVAVSGAQMHKLAWLVFAAFCMGANMGPLVGVVLEQNPE